MDHSEVDRLIERHLIPLSKFLGLDRYRIILNVERISDDDTIARVYTEEGYQHARITLDPQKITDADHLINVLAHELLHIVINPVQDVVDAFLDNNDSPIVKKLGTAAVERTISNLMVLWRTQLGPTYFAINPLHPTT